MKKRLTKGMLMTALICGTISVLPFGGTVAHAEDATTEESALQGFTLDQIVVTATRTPVTEFDAHANLNVITAKDIENRHYTTVKDALRDVPGVVIYEYGSPGHEMSSSIRLNGSNQVVVLVDGVRVSQSDITPLASTMFVPVENIERIETLKGAASALYGADAKGGVINIITKQTAEPVTKIRAEAGSFGAQEYALYTQGTTENKKLTYRVNAKINKLGDAKDGHGDKIIQDLDAKTVGFFLKNEFSEGTDLSIGYNKYKSDFKYEDKFYGGGITDGNTDTDEWTVISNQKFNDKVANRFALKYLKFNNKYSDLSPATTQYKSRSWEIDDQLTAKLSDSNTLVVGLNYMHDKFDFASEDMWWGRSDINETIIKKAIFLQDEWKFAKKWDLNTGLRYDNHSIAGSAFTPRFNVGYEADKNNNMYLSYNRFFVAPTAYQYFSTYYGVGNRDLKPEKGYTWEIGWNHKFDDTASLATHLFYRKSHDAVGYDNATWKYGNIEKEKAKGFDIQFKKAFEKGFSMSLGYTYTNTKQTTDGNVNHNVSGFVPKHAINLGLSYNSKKFDVDLMARACLDRNSTIPGFFPSKNYVVTDLAVNYKPIKELKAYIKVNNLFDKFYTECSAVESYDPVGTAGRWYTMPGRSIVAGIEYSF